MNEVDKFAYYLDTPFSIRDRLEKEHNERLGKENEDTLSNDDKKRLWKCWTSALISVFLDNHPAPTWGLVANALSWMGRKDTKLREALTAIYKLNKVFPGECVVSKQKSRAAFPPVA